jgi:hypothetical protein
MCMLFYVGPVWVLHEIVEYLMKNKDSCGRRISHRNIAFVSKLTLPLFPGLLFMFGRYVIKKQNICSKQLLNYYSCNNNFYPSS